jgi:PAS domain S-box-containing protein
VTLPSSQTSQADMRILFELLTQPASMPRGSQVPASLWLPRYLKEAIDKLGLAGGFVTLIESDQADLLAQHGIPRAAIDQATDQVVRSLIQSEAEVLSRPEAATRQGQAPAIMAQLDDVSYVAFNAPLGTGQWLITAFANRREPTQHQVEILGLVAAHVARMVADAKMVNQAQAARDEINRLNGELKEMQVCSLNIMEDLQRKNRDLSKLNEISQRMASWSNLPELARNAAEAASSILDNATVIIYIRDQAQQRFEPYQASRQCQPRDGSSLAIQSSDPIYAKISEGKEIRFDVCDQQVGARMARSLGTKTGLIMPLRSKQEIPGFLLVSEERWHRIFTDEEIENLRVLASSLAVAMDNASLLASATRQFEEMSILKEYIETVVDSVDLAIMVVDEKLTITMFNRGFERLYGYKKEEFLGRPVFEAMPHLLEQGFTEIAQQVFRGEPFVRYGWRRGLRDGSQAVQNFRVFPHRDASGTIIGGIAIIEDITERVKLEDQLARSEAKFSRLVEDLDDGYLIISQGRISYANKAASQLTGLPVHQLLGMEAGAILADHQLLAQCQQPIGHKLRRESKISHATGTWIPVEITLSDCEYGGASAVSVVIRDITETKKFEKQLEDKNREMRLRNEQITRLNQELEATVNQLKVSQESLIKSERIAAITETSIAANHEINNPLFAILGQAQLLLRKYKGRDKDTLDRLRVIEESALRIACVTKKLANLADPVVKEYSGLAATMIDVDRSTSK